MTWREWSLLGPLAAHPGRVMLAPELLIAGWGPGYRDDLPYLRVWISRLHHTLAAPGEPGSMRTYRGIGYALVANAGDGRPTCFGREAAFGGRRPRGGAPAPPYPIGWAPRGPPGSCPASPPARGWPQVFRTTPEALALLGGGTALGTVPPPLRPRSAADEPPDAPPSGGPRPRAE